MDCSSPLFKQIQSQHQEMAELLIHWVNINSATRNRPGLERMLEALKKAFSPLGGVMQEISLPPESRINEQGDLVQEPLGKALFVKKHPHAPIQIFLGGHMDTVYPSDHPFQKAEYLDPNTLRGPGAADMKGGLIILLYTLKALEDSPLAGKIGWEVLINPDEEIGSPGSTDLFKERAAFNQLALLFEPSFSDGAIVSSRKGSANFTVVSRGKTAHSGRDFHSGRNAITALARFLIKAEAHTNKERETTVNIGLIKGGHAANIVPDLAIATIDVRVKTHEDLQEIKKHLSNDIQEANQQEGIFLTLHQITEREPKAFDRKNEALFDALNASAIDCGYTLQTRPSGGVCDGNILSSAGLPTIDTLGGIGGNIHTSDEYVHLNSLVDRVQLLSHFLIQNVERQIVARFFQMFGFHRRKC